MPSLSNINVNQRWEIVNKIKDAENAYDLITLKIARNLTTWDKCKKNHHRSLQSERKDQEKPPLDLNAVPAQTHNDNTVNNNANLNSLKLNGDVKTVAGLLPVQKNQS